MNKVELGINTDVLIWLHFRFDSFFFPKQLFLHYILNQRLFILEHVSLNMHHSTYMNIYRMFLEIFGLNQAKVYLKWWVIVGIMEESYV